MAGIPISIDRGVNYSDAQPGELCLARNCHYLPESRRLTKVRGRTAYGTLGSAATGLQFIRFQGGTGYLIGSAGTSYYTSPVDGASWTASASSLSAVGKMEAVYFAAGNAAYVADGVNRLQVWTGSGSMRNGGLLRPSQGSIALLANAATTYQVGTTRSFTHTEYDPTNDIESAPADVVELATTADGDTFKYTLPATQTNSSVSGLKYRIYATQHGRSVFYLLAEIAGTNLRYYDGSDTDGLSNDTDNFTVWGFISVDDIFLSTQKVLDMIGQPLLSNYITVNSAPPIGNIMTVFENSLVIGGVPGYDQDWFFSEANYPENFSPVSFVREDNAYGSPLTALGVANQRLIAFNLTSIYRHDGLPRVTNPGFTQGTSRREPVTEDHGCIAKRTVANFGIGHNNNLLFYLSNFGPMATDGYETHPVGEDMGWHSGMYNPQAMSGAVAKNYPKYSQIRLFLPSRSSTTNDICMVFHYHPNHAKVRDGRLTGKWTGPVHVRCAAATVVQEKDSETRMFLADTDSSGSIFQEDNGKTDEQYYEDSTGNINWEWETDDFDLGTKTKLKKIARVFLETTGAEDPFTPRMTYAVDKADAEREIVLENQTVNANKPLKFGTSVVDRPVERIQRGGVHQNASHFRFHMQETAIGDRQVSALEVEMDGTERQK